MWTDEQSGGETGPDERWREARLKETKGREGREDVSEGRDRSLTYAADKPA